jgi:hypothetical protein
MFYNIAPVRNHATTDPRLKNYAESFPDNDCEGSTHQEMYVVKRQQLPLLEALKAATLKNKYGLALKTLAVGDLIGLVSIPSDSTLNSVCWDVTSITGLVGRMVLVAADGAAPAALEGSLHTRVDTTVTTASGDGDDVGAAVAKHVLETNVYVGPTRYVAFEVTALPADWATCPRVPDVEFFVNFYNHMTSFAKPNV